MEKDDRHLGITPLNGQTTKADTDPECLQSLSRMGEASPLLWVASGGSDGPFGHHC